MLLPLLFKSKLLLFELFWTNKEFILWVGVSLKFNPKELLILAFVLYPLLLNIELDPAPLILALEPLNTPELFILNGLAAFQD